MRFKFIRSLGVVVDTVRTQNVGYDYEHIIARLRQAGHDFEEVDGTSLSDEERVKLRGDAWSAFMGRRTKKGRMLDNSFGTHGYPWQDFGTGIPALFRYDDGECVDVYPHEEDSRFITIREYMDSTQAQ